MNIAHSRSRHFSSLFLVFVSQDSSIFRLMESLLYLISGDVSILYSVHCIVTHLQYKCDRQKQMRWKIPFRHHSTLTRDDLLNIMNNSYLRFCSPTNLRRWCYYKFVRDRIICTNFFFPLSFWRNSTFTLSLVHGHHLKWSVFFFSVIERKAQKRNNVNYFVIRRFLQMVWMGWWPL